MRESKQKRYSKKKIQLLCEFNEHEVFLNGVENFSSYRENKKFLWKKNYKDIQNHFIINTHLLLLPLALQPAVGFGLSNKILPFFPICHQLSRSSFKSIQLFPFFDFHNNMFFTVWGCQPHAKTPTCRTRVPLFVWVITLDLSGMGGPTSSIATVA
jgi:hypothetical protein